MVILTLHFQILSGGRDDFAKLNLNASATNLIQIRPATFPAGKCTLLFRRRVHRAGLIASRTLWTECRALLDKFRALLMEFGGFWSEGCFESETLMMQYKGCWCDTGLV